MTHLTITKRRNALQFILSAVFSLTLAFSGGVFAGGALSAEYERVIAKPASEVWKVVGNFNELHVWHPAVVSTDASGGGTTAGDKRLLTLGDGATIDEELLAYDDAGMSLSYKILEGPLPVSNYESTIRVTDNGDGSSKVIWSSTFDASGASDDEAINVITGVYSAGLDAVN